VGKLELALRLFNAGLGYVFLALCLTENGLLADYAILLPLSGFISIFFDLGRVEKAALRGLDEAELSAIKLQLLCYITLPIFLVIFAKLALGNYSEFDSPSLYTALGITGLSQISIDMLLRAEMKNRRSSLRVSIFQCIIVTCNCALAATSLSTHLKTPTVLLLLSAAPALFTYIFLMTGVFEFESPQKIEPGSKLNRFKAILYRALPVCIYAASIKSAELIGPIQSIYIRVAFFAFGIMHIRIMSRQLGDSNFLINGLAIFIISVIFGLPLALYSRGLFDSISALKTIWSIPHLILISILFSLFLSSYRKFIDAR
jgi:hypothetical protein